MSDEYERSPAEASEYGGYSEKQVLFSVPRYELYKGEMGLATGILGVGSYLPPRRVRNAELPGVSPAMDEWIVSRVGIRERRICLEDQATSDLAYEAAVDALKQANVDPADISLIIVAASNHDMVMPTTACIVQSKLCAKNSMAMDIRAGCAGFITAAVTGAKFIEDGSARYVLAIGAEVHSKMMDWNDFKSSAFFSDGAGAVVLGRVPQGYGILASYLMAEGDLADALVVPAGGSRLPASHETVDQGLHNIQHDGKKIWRFATRVFPASVREACKRAGVEVADLDFVVPHQANIRMIEKCMEDLGLPMTKTHVTVDKYGNSASGTIPITLREAVDMGKIGRDSLVALTAFGAGLTYGATVMRWY